jgi:hypothetical protein
MTNAELMERVRELEDALQGVMLCRKWDSRGEAIEDVLRAEFAAADRVLKKGRPVAPFPDHNAASNAASKAST